MPEQLTQLSNWLKKAKPQDEQNIIDLSKVGRNQTYPYILNISRYAMIVRKTFGELAEEIISKSQLGPLYEKGINVTDYQGIVIGSFVITDQTLPKGKATCYITKVQLANNENAYPIITQEGFNRGKVTKYESNAKRF